MDFSAEDYLGLTDNAIRVLEKRYLKKDINGKCIETPSGMFFRVAKAVASAETCFGKTPDETETCCRKFYEIMAKRYFLPNSPTLMNAGKELGQLSACFVLPVEDSLEGIFETLKYTALIHKSGGGTGFSFSRLRPKNSVVKSTMGVSSGPISFMEVYNAATEAVKQGGTRRGANMGILRVDHPDILDFICCKKDNNKLNNFNISVAVTDKFMEAVKSGTDYDLINPQNNEIYAKLNAREVFDTISDNAWKNGEPGIIFIDRVNRDNPTPLTGKIEATNPCGEVPLLPYEACNLGSINLGLMADETQEGMKVNWERLADVVRAAVRFLDDVIEINNFPLPQIKQTVMNNRKIGLGVMGLSDLLMKMGISYASEEGIKLGAQVMEFIDYASKYESVELAKERGRFNNFSGSLYDSPDYLLNKFAGKSAGIIQESHWKELGEKISRYGIRNATTTCIAPTGTISMIANASGGIEPLFGLVFTRLILDGTQMSEVNSVFKDCLEKRGLYSDDLINLVSKNGSVKYIDWIPEDIKKIFVTAHDIPPYWHVMMQAAFQLHTDNAVSKTVNFEEFATKQDIKDVYMLAYEKNLKGITVYRNNSRQFQPMNIDTTKQDSEDYNPSGDIKTVTCPECGNTIEMAEGCFICRNCGYTGCS